MQAIIIFPRFKGLKEVQQIRKKYDSQFKLVKPHITLVFPFEKDFSEKILDKHIKKSIKDFKAFEIILKGIKKSPKEYYLYLLVEKGKNQILKLHKKLYSKLLIKWLNKDIPYIPHITLGVFKSKKQINGAVKKIKKDISFKCTVDSIYLLNLDKDLVTLKSSRRYRII